MKKTTAAILVAAGIAILGLPQILSADSARDARLMRNLETFSSIVRQVETSYVDTINTDKAFNAAISGYLMDLDPYTEYFTEQETKDFSNQTQGEYAGIGSYIMKRGDYVVLTGPYANSPARLAGLRAGDKIARVDTTDAKGMSVDEVKKHLMGPAGTKVQLSVIRPHTQDSVIEVTVERRKVNLPSVSYSGEARPGIGYIKIDSYMEKTGHEVEKALEKFASDPNIKGVVLDLRGNGGGLLNAAIDVLGNFLPKGTEVLRTRGNENVGERVYRTSKAPLMADMPLAVLIDGGSASASEVTAGALQDLDRAVLVGNRSFGKGLVQSTLQLPYNAMVKVTTARYYIPSGRLIQALDYSKRDEQGNAIHRPDSLANVFLTKAGREVRDGGGLSPDVKVTDFKVNSLLYDLVNQQVVFDYSVKYAAEHPAIPAPEDFEVTDSIYADFCAFASKAPLKRSRNLDKFFNNLRDNLKDEGQLTPEVQSHINLLDSLLQPDLSVELDSLRSRISYYLGPEIVSRYYFAEGETRNTIRSDEALDTATEILLDPKRYKELLTAPSKAESRMKAPVRSGAKK